MTDTLTVPQTEGTSNTQTDRFACPSELSAVVYSPETRRALENLLSLSPAQLRREEVSLRHFYKCSLSGFTAERGCGCLPVKHGAGTPGVRLRHYKHGTSSAYFSALQRSKSFTCPISHLNKVMRQREENSYLAAEHIKTGGTLLSGTFTMRTTASTTPAFFYAQKEQFRRENKDMEGDFYDLKESGYEAFLASNPRSNSWDAWDLNRRLDAVNDGIKRMFDGGSGWQRNKAAYKLIGRILSIEIVVTPTWVRQPNGAWLPSWKKVQHHIHIHFLLPSELTPEELAELGVASLLNPLAARWQKGLALHGFSATKSAQHLVPVALTADDVRRQASYLAKPMTVDTATETVAAGTSIDGDKPTASSSFDDILRDAAFGVFDTNGELHPKSHDAKLWWQNFEGACHGRHFHRISPTLSTRYGLKAFREQTAAEYKAKVAEVEDCAFFDREVWNSLIKSNPAIRTQLLNLAENEGSEAVREFLTENDIPFRLPGQPKSPTAADATAAREQEVA